MTSGTRDSGLLVPAKLPRSGVALLCQIHDLILAQLTTRTKELEELLD